MSFVILWSSPHRGYLDIWSIKFKTLILYKKINKQQLCHFSKIKYKCLTILTALNHVLVRINTSPNKAKPSQGKPGAQKIKD